MPIPPPEIIIIDDDADEVCCDGGGVMGHPVVWYALDNKDINECGYCDRAFVKRRAEKAYRKSVNKTA